MNHKQMHRPMAAWLLALLLLAPAGASAAKPKAKPAKTKSAEAKPEEAAGDKPAPNIGSKGKDNAGKDTTATDAKDIDKKGHDKPKPARPDPTEALLGVSGQSALVALLHSHFALTGLGHAMRAGALNGQDVAIQAGTLQQNLQGLSQQFGQLATHPAFDPQLADLWRSLGQTAALGAQAAMALSDFCAHKDEPPFAVAFEDRLEAFRSRLQGLIASLQAGGK